MRRDAGKSMASMRSIVLIALAGAILGPLSVAARAEGVHDSMVGKSQTSLKRIVVPSEKMMLRSPNAAGLTPGAANRGMQLVDPAGVRGGQNSNAAVQGTGRTQDQDTPASAAENITTDASRMDASAAAAMSNSTRSQRP